MKTVFIFHDSFSNPTADWIPWVKVHLEAQGYFVITPGFPTPAGESYESWHTIFSPYISKVDGESIFIGHGTGAVFAIRILESLSVPVAGTILVAPYARKLEHQGYQKVSETFLAKTFEWEKVRANSGVGAILHGDNDPFVPATEGKFVAEAMRIAPQIVTDGGHLNRASGFDKFLQLVTTVRDIQKAIAERVHATSTEGIAEHLAREEAEAKKYAEIEASDKLRGLRTMESDLGRTLNSKSGTVISEVMKTEQEKEKIAEAVNPKSTKNMILIVCGTILLIGGLGTAGYFFMMQNPTPVPITTNAEPKTNSIIRSDRAVTISLDNVPQFEMGKKLVAAHRERPIPGTVLEYVPALSNDRIPFFNLLDVLGIKSAPILLRGYLNQNFMWGAYGVGAQQAAPFLVFQTNSYDGVYAGLRDWEPVMAQSLGVFFNLPKDFIAIEKKWEWADELVANKTIRTLRFVSPTPIGEVKPAVATVAENNKTPVEDNTTSENPATVADSNEGVINNLEENFSPFETGVLVPEKPKYSYKDGDLVLLYMFINERTFIITNRDDILSELIRRYADKQVLE